MAATVFAVYLLTWVLFEDRMAAWFAALIMALTPQQIVWSATAAVEPTASLACVTAILCAALFLRSRTTVALAATACSAAYAIQFRPESPLVLLVIGVLLWRTARTELGRARLWWCGLLFVVLAAANIGHLVAVRNENWGTSEARLSLRYVIPNLRVNGWFYVWDWRFPAAFTLLAIIGLFARRFSPERLAIAGYFALFFVMDLLFYAGSYNYGADVRYSLLTYPPVAILAGVGASRLSRRVTSTTYAMAGRAVVAGALAFQFLWYLPGVRATTQEAWAARADVRFARSFVRNLPSNSFVLTHNPGMFHVWGVNAGQMSLLMTTRRIWTICPAVLRAGSTCTGISGATLRIPFSGSSAGSRSAADPRQLVSEYRERDYRYAIYRLERPAERCIQTK